MRTTRACAGDASSATCPGAASTSPSAVTVTGKVCTCATAVCATTSAGVSASPPPASASAAFLPHAASARNAIPRTAWRLSNRGKHPSISRPPETSS